MKRKTKYLLSVVLILIQIISISGLSFAMLQDTQSHWAKPQIEKYTGMGVIVGYSDNTFRPDNFITRAEFVTILNKYFGFDELAEIGFLDVPENAWYRAQIQKAVMQGYIRGYDDNRFRPDEYITRNDAAVIVAKLLDVELLTENNEVKIFSDWSKIPAWSLKYVNAIVKHGLMKGYPDNTIRVDQNLTRAEALMLLDKMQNQIPRRISKITSIELTNGTITVSLDKFVSDLSLSDFKVTATIDDYSYTLSNLSFDATNNSFTFTPFYKTSSIQELKVEVAANSDKITGSATDTFEIPRRERTSRSSTPPPVETNNPPTTPVITRTPTGNVGPTDQVTITATSTDPEGDAITYIWEGRLAETSVYPLGKNVIKVKAVDSKGNESQQAAIVFFVIDTTSGSGGVLLTNENSRIYENGIEGATITNFTFNVPSVSGHWGSDYAWVRGLNVNTQEWEYVPNVSGTTLGYDQYSNLVNVPISGNPVYVSNGVYLEANIPVGTYSRLEFFYYASHCMYGQSNITYTVEFAFTDLGPSVPAEAAPVASVVEVGGTHISGGTLTGGYQYTDANGDLEGVVDEYGNIDATSLYQWYRSDDAAGTGKTAIPGATTIDYTITNDDMGKYLSFEVTPRAITGVPGTLIGTPVESARTYVKYHDAKVLSFSVPGQTSDPALIDDMSNTVTLAVESTTDVTTLVPTITVSNGAVVVPASLTPTDFTSPVIFTVTSEDGLNIIPWTVTVTVAPPL